jgi:hypothetical protein
MCICDTGGTGVLCAHHIDPTSVYTTVPKSRPPSNGIRNTILSEFLSTYDLQ